MIKEAINRILELGGPKVLEIDGLKYVDNGLRPVTDPVAGIIQLRTLTGLVDYLESGPDDLDKGCLMIHVEGFDKVLLRSALFGDFKQRETLISVELDRPNFHFGHWHSHEEFVIALQSVFEDSEDLSALREAVSGLVAEGKVENTDDGVSQSATVRKGVTRVGNIVLPNPVSLIPFRTFAEVGQPASKFVFRVRHNDGAFCCALFEADGGEWKNRAMANIFEWLKTKVKGISIIA